MDINKLHFEKKIGSLCMLTCYDAQMARILEHAGIDMILVGDSLGMVVSGDTSTKHVTMSDMLHHVAAVKRGAPNTFIVGDMPIATYDTPEDALKNAQALIDAGASAVKFEGYLPNIVTKLVTNNIPVMGHIGLLPQKAKRYRVIGKKDAEHAQLLREAKGLESCGVFALVIESVPSVLGSTITDSVHIPTIGIGAGSHCDGQVLVINDMLGMDPSFSPKFLKRYADLYTLITNSVKQYMTDIRTGQFPDKEYSYE